MTNDVGRSPSGPGSCPTGGVATASPAKPSIPSATRPRRAHVFKVEFGANTLDDLIYALNQTAIDLRMGTVASSGCSGSPSVGFTYEYDVDESWTKDRYFDALDEWLIASGTPTQRAETIGSVGEADGGPTQRVTPKSDQEEGR